MNKKKKVLVGLLFLLLIELTPTIVTNSQTSPSSAYVAGITVPSNPFILDTATLPAINQLGSNIRFFQYPNLTGQLYAYEQQLPQTTPTVDSVESTAWKVFPYWQNGELVINTLPHSVSVTVSNSQSIATPAPFDQFLNITESQIASALGSTTASNLWQQATSDHFLNLLFQQNGQTLYAWVQNYTSSWVAVWVNLPNGIPASSSVEIGLLFSNSIQYPHTGIYSAVYPGYDNGVNVFTQYGYFGNQVPSGWTTGVYAGSFTPTSTTNGLEMINNGGNEGTYVYASLPNMNDYTVIASWWYSGSADALTQELYGNPSSLSPVTNIGSTGGGSTPYAPGGTVAQNEIYTSSAYIKNSTSYIGIGFESAGTYYVTTYFAIQGNTQYYGYRNHGSPFQITLPSSFVSFHLITDRTSSTVFIGAGDGGSTAYIYLNLVIVIPTPPNNVMPSITSVSTISGGQYIAWKYSPISNTINVTIHVTSFPEITYDPGIVVYSPNIGYQTGDDDGANFQGVLVSFTGTIWFHSPTGSWELLYSSLPQPNPNYPFTFSAILTENSAGNVTVSTVYINSTAYTVNVNTPLPWSQIGYAGIRGDLYDIFYVSYFGVSPSPYYNAEQFVNNVESTFWKVLPYWQNGELVINSIGASVAGQYIAWRYSPVSNVVNVTIHVTSYPSGGGNPGIVVYSPNIGDQPSDGNSGFYVLLVDFLGDSIYYRTPTSGYVQLYSSLPQPNPNYPFTFSVILTENSASNITVSTVYINGTAYSVNVNTPFPWS